LDGKNIRTPWISIDAAFGAHHDDKGHTGLVKGIGKSGFNFRSSKQRIVTKSSTEFEIIGESDSLSNAMHTRDFLKLQVYTLNPTIFVYHHDGEWRRDV